MLVKRITELMRLALMLLVSSSTLVLPSGSWAYELESEKKILIKKLLEQTGQSPKDVGRNFSRIIIAEFTRRINDIDPKLEPRAFTMLEDEVQNLIYSEIVIGNRFQSLIYPVYDKYFTASDLRAMIEFNETPAGRKRIKVMQLVGGESMQIGRALGQELSRKIEKRFQSRLNEVGIEFSFSSPASQE